MKKRYNAHLFNKAFFLEKGKEMFKEKSFKKGDPVSWKPPWASEGIPALFVGPDEGTTVILEIYGSPSANDPGGCADYHYSDGEKIEANIDSIMRR